MGVMTIRFNEKEEKVLLALQSYFDSDKSKIVKEALFDLHEEIYDREVIENNEQIRKKKKPKFYKTEEIIKKIQI